MGYKRFRMQCVARVVLLGATVSLFVYLLSQTALYVTTAIVGAVGLYQIYALLRYVERTNRDLVRFLQGIRAADFSPTFSGKGWGVAFEELHAAFTGVMDDFRRARSEKEEHAHVLQTVLQHVGIGVLAFQKDGEVALINAAARRLLNLQSAAAPDPGRGGQSDDLAAQVSESPHFSARIRLNPGAARTSPLRNITGLESFSKPLVETLRRLKPGDRAVVNVGAPGDVVQLAIAATACALRGHHLTLVSLQNIQSELEEKELEAWQSLIRVLSHEIMNSITPIASLTSTIIDLLPAEERSGEVISSDTLSDIRGALQTIQRRSQGLLHFVDAYRSLTHLPNPAFQIVLVAELFERVHRLMGPQFRDKAIAVRMAVDPDRLELTADPELVEQVILNLLLNAVQAMEGQPEASITVTARLDARGRVVIQVADNGPGIVEDAQEKLFVPFFTTKKDGSGIGLSLSRQIMRLHRGTIRVHSIPHVETVVTLRF